MKFALVASQFFLFCCLPRRYRITRAYLLVAIPATLALRPESGWLQAWYPALEAPVAFLRVAAGIEISYRQTVGFRFWTRLTGTG